MTKEEARINGVGRSLDLGRITKIATLIAIFPLVIVFLGRFVQINVREAMKEYVGGNSSNRFVNSYALDKPIVCVAGIRQRPASDSMFPDFDNDVTNAAYVRSLQASGAYPMLLPSTDPLNIDIIHSQMKMCDALLLQGGQDVEPVFYNEDKTELCGETDIHMDKNHIEMYNTALRMGIPVLGICRGFQLMNVASGGTLYQDLSQRQLPPGVRQDNHRDLESYREPKAHALTVEEGSVLADILKTNRVMVNSIHHQGVKDLGKGFRVTARSADGLVEGIERMEEGTWVVGVQFHPEILAAGDGSSAFLALIRRYVAEAERARASRSGV